MVEQRFSLEPNKGDAFARRSCSSKEPEHDLAFRKIMLKQAPMAMFPELFALQVQDETAACRGGLESDAITSPIAI
jgi:hypothetical protein